MGGIEPLTPCVPCSKRGISRLATCTLEMLDSSVMPVCDTCESAFPMHKTLRVHFFHDLPWAEEARRHNEVVRKQERLNDKLNRPVDR